MVVQDDGKSLPVVVRGAMEYVARAGTPGRYAGAEADLCAFGNDTDETAKNRKLTDQLGLSHVQ